MSRRDPSEQNSDLSGAVARPPSRRKQASMTAMAARARVWRNNAPKRKATTNAAHTPTATTSQDRASAHDRMRARARAAWRTWRASLADPNQEWQPPCAKCAKPRRARARASMGSKADARSRDVFAVGMHAALFVALAFRGDYPPNSMRDSLMPPHGRTAPAGLKWRNRRVARFEFVFVFR